MPLTRVKSKKSRRALDFQRIQPRQLPAFILLMPTYPKRFLVPEWFVRQFVFWFAFLCQCNILPNAFGMRFLRISDPLVLVFLPFLFLFYYRSISSSLLSIHILPIVIGFLLSLLLFHERQQSELYSSAFTFLYFLFALPFTYLLLKEQLLERFCWATLAGFTATAILLMIDPYLRDSLVKVGLSFQFDYDSIAQGAAKGDSAALAQLLRFEKAGGLWTHGNEAGPVFALAAAAAAYLSEQRRNTLLYAAFVLIFAITFTQTANRSGFITILAIGGLFFSRNFSMRIAGNALVYGLGGIVAIAVAFPFGIFDTLGDSLARRFLEDDNASSNLADRFMTLLNGVQVMISNPFGIGIGARVSEMQQLGGYATPHNGFIATAFSNGVMYLVFLVSAIVYVLTRRRKVSFFFYAGICLAGAYMFEEVNATPPMMLYAGMVVAYTCLDVEYRLFRGRQLQNMLMPRTQRLARKLSLTRRAEQQVNSSTTS